MANICSKCGNSVSINQHYCTNCGKPVTRDKPQLPKSHKMQNNCLICGTANELKRGYVSCGVESTWKWQNEKGQDQTRINKDDISIWDFELCHSCTCSMFASKIDKIVAKKFTELGTFLSLIAAGFFSGFIVWLREIGFFSFGIFNLPGSLALTAGLFAGIIGVLAFPGALKAFIKVRLKKTNFERKKELIHEDYVESYKEAGENVLKILQNDKNAMPLKFMNSNLYNLPLASNKLKLENIKTKNTPKMVSTQFNIIGAGAVAEGSVNLKWADIYLLKKGEGGKENLRKICDQEISNVPNRFLTWAFSVAGIFVASGIGASIYNGPISTVLALPGGLFLGIAFAIFWFISLSEIISFNSVFGKYWLSKSGLRFHFYSLLSIGLIVFGIVFAVWQHKINIKTHFNKWGVSFIYPEEWWKVNERTRKSMQDQFASSNEASRIKHFTALGIGKGDNTEGYVFVSIEKPNTKDTFTESFLARKNQLEEAESSGDVSKIYKCDTLTINGHQAIETDVERGSLGRGHDIHIMFPGNWVAVALVGSDMVALHDKEFRELWLSINYKQR